MTTRRGSQYSIQSDGGRLRHRNDPTKGQSKGKSTQESFISQRQVPEIPVISEPDLELSLSFSNRNQLHSEDLKRHIHEPLKAVLHHLQGQIFGNFATNKPSSDELLAYPEKVPQRRGNGDILQFMDSTIIQTSNQKHKGLEQQKEGEKQGRSSSSLY
ncbi:hypothetical protein O181_046957 [Austropuccinia psidii MF-1]|uniref:Uncharacterized protein n=1 Tax=Austropuccinia psidii MF-1 TaxID=1389203 RepID=A0A9Q3DWX4_9BASI|nr:hypothetical protein [Austropuccinia psidii MF-1]